MELPRTVARARFIWLSHASSSAVMCSAVFSTSGTRIKPTKLLRVSFLSVTMIEVLTRP